MENTKENPIPSKRLSADITITTIPHFIGYPSGFWLPEPWFNPALVL